MTDQDQQNSESPTPKRKGGSLPRKKPGAPLGNTNRLKHGFYSKKLKQDYLDQLQAYEQEHGGAHSSDITTIRAAIYTVLDHCPQKLTPVQAVALLRAVTQASNTIDRRTRPSTH